MSTFQSSYRFFPVIYLSALLMGCDFSVSKTSFDKQPNIILILADDQGWGSTSLQMDINNAFSASDFVRTPRLVELAKSGTVFSNGYAAHPNCSPTRASILTGKTPAQLKMTDIVNRHSGPFFEGNKLIPPVHVQGLSKSEKTIVELIKQNDPTYKTAHFGKWHLKGGGPEVHGFDKSDGATSNKEGNMNLENNPKDIFGITKRGLNWMTEQVKSESPFYLQLSHYATHLAIEAKPETLKKAGNYSAGNRHNLVNHAAMTEDLDTGVGMVLDAIKNLGIEDNTYIIYLADNGTYPTNNPQNINGPLHGWKATLWEGGIKVPFIIAGPGIAHGYSNVPVTSSDILPTICDWLDIEELPSDLDGGSIAPVVSSEYMADQVRRDNDFLLFYFPHYQHQKGTHPGVAIIQENYKLIKFYEENKTLLFNLADDPEEIKDLAGEFPEKVVALEKRIDNYFSEHQILLPTKNKNYSPDLDEGKKYVDVKGKLIKEPYFILNQEEN